jgi:vacuolar protein 8
VYLARKAANRVKIAEAGGIELLVALLRDGTQEGKEYAAMALGSVAYGNDANRVKIAEAGGIELLIVLLRDGTEEGKKYAAVALHFLHW